ncbi:MAG TPA: BLUF domain-containing protein, partial [Streptosporangiaceae bacterium]|nr:BLUF domain-containing protein [Streptosporangiaceae bacterium]
GALLISGDWFAQTLEGDEDTVRALFATIERDSRHERVSVLEDQTAPGRVFARWAMARVSADGEPDIRLIAGTGGIIPAAGRGTTPEQEPILYIMREATRGDAHTI